MQAVAAILLVGMWGSVPGSFPRPARVTYWVQAPGEYDFVIKGHLGVDHERICAVVIRDADATDSHGKDATTKDGGLWDTVTMKSAGARVGISRNKLPLDAARRAAEQDCR
jgi:hypothetical protein